MSGSAERDPNQVVRAEAIIERLAHLPRAKQEYLLGFVEHLEREKARQAQTT